MFNISSYLQKFSKNLVGAEEVINTVISVIQKETNILLSKDSVEVKNGVVHITSSPAVKNKIFIYKKAILDHIAPLKISDIR